MSPLILYVLWEIVSRSDEQGSLSQSQRDSSLMELLAAKQVRQRQHGTAAAGGGGRARRRAPGGGVVVGPPYEPWLAVVAEHLPFRSLPTSPSRTWCGCPSTRS